MNRARYPLAFESGRLALTHTPGEALGTEIAEWCLFGRGDNPYHQRDGINLAIEAYQIGNAAGAAGIRRSIEDYFKKLANQGKARLKTINMGKGADGGKLQIMIDYIDLASGTERRATI
jgi:hypothetical protein